MPVRAHSRARCASLWWAGTSPGERSDSHAPMAEPPGTVCALHEQGNQPLHQLKTARGDALNARCGAPLPHTRRYGLRHLSEPSLVDLLASARHHAAMGCPISHWFAHFCALTPGEKTYPRVRSITSSSLPACRWK